MNREYKLKWICLECEKKVDKEKIEEIGECPSCGSKVFEVEVLGKIKESNRESISKPSHTERDYYCPKCSVSMEYRRNWRDQDENLLHELYCNKCKKKYKTEYPLSFVKKKPKKE